MSRLTIAVPKSTLTAIEREKIFFFIENRLSTYIENKDISNADVIHALIGASLSNALDEEVKGVD